MTQTTSSYTDLTTTSPSVLTLLTSPGSAALRIENSELPDPIQVDETEHREVTRRLGAGVQVYDRNPGVGGVVHTHSTHLVALTLAGVWHPDDILPPITPYQVMKVGHIPLIPYARPGAARVAEQVAQLANRVRGVMLERLGPVVWESSVSKASFALEELEETARLWLLSEPRPAPLDAAALAELAETFGATW